MTKKWSGLVTLHVIEIADTTACKQDNGAQNTASEVYRRSNIFEIERYHDGERKKVNNKTGQFAKQYKQWHSLGYTGIYQLLFVLSIDFCAFHGLFFYI